MKSPNKHHPYGELVNYGKIRYATSMPTISLSDEHCLISLFQWNKDNKNKLIVVCLHNSAMKIQH